MKKLTQKEINNRREAEGKPPLNFALFQKVITKLQTAPEAYDQTTAVEDSNEAPCGTAACIGGWADILSASTIAETQQRMRRVSLDRAADSLGLDGADWSGEFTTERAILFDGGPGQSWPEPYCDQWKRARTLKQRARVAVRYLKHIVA